MAYALNCVGLQYLAADCYAVHAMTYMAYAIRHHNCRKTQNRQPLPNNSKTTSDVGKTTSYAGKIISDIIQTTSDLFFATCNALKNKPLQQTFLSWVIYWNSILYAVLTILAVPLRIWLYKTTAKNETRRASL